MNRFFTLFLLLAAATGGATAQTKLAPGLWEYSTRLKAGGGGQMDAAMARMQEQLAAMPPEKRKQMEDAMAQRGIAMPGAGGAGGGMTMKVCITPDKAARDEVPVQEGNCKQTSRSRSGNTVKFTLECSGPRKATGEGEFTFISDKEHKGRVKMTTLRGTQEETVEVETSSRWLGADCGEVKPRP